jgi:uncharacterized protein YlbG (UPF0298 family)
MARLEYAATTKQGQHKLRRDSAEVHKECKSVLVYLMENRQARKISSTGIIAWKDQKHSISEFRIPGIGGVKEANLDKNVETTKCETSEYVDLTPFRSFGYQEIEEVKS